MQARQSVTAGPVPAAEALAVAAPDLLAALKAIVLETMPYSPARPSSADSYLPPHLIEAAQAAIAKAEGRP